MSGSQRDSFPQIIDHSDFFSKTQKSLIRGTVVLHDGREAVVSSLKYNPKNGVVVATLRSTRDNRRVKVKGKIYPRSPRGMLFSGKKAFIPGVNLFATLVSGVT